MQTRYPQRHRILLATIFALVCVLLMMLAYRSFGGTMPFEPKGYRFSLSVQDKRNLVAGSDVQQAGVKIGRVVGVRRAGREAVVTVELKSRYAPIRSRDQAMVRTKSLLGEAYLQLLPGPADATTLDEGGTLAASQVRPDVSFNEFLDGFGPQRRADLRQLFGGLARAFDDRSSQLNRSLGYAAPVSADLLTTLSTLRAQRDDLQELFGSSAVVLDALGRRRRDVQDAITAGGRVFDAMASRDRALSETVHELPAFLTELDRTSDSITASSAPLVRASRTLLSVSPYLPGALDALETQVPKFDAAFRDVPQTVAAARRGLPALDEIVGAIPSAFPPLQATLRELIPVVQLVADYADVGLVGAFANAGSVFNGVTVGPRGKIVHRVNGVLYLANETIVGWEQRLPTNRANPYPKPDAFSQLGKQGFLNSYDCRNANRPSPLPPLGTGVPPCKEQGAWTYRGKTAFYPRLRRSPP